MRADDQLLDAQFDASSGAAGPRFGVAHPAALAAGVLALLGLLACAWLALRPAPHGEALPPRDQGLPSASPGVTPVPGLSAAAATPSAVAISVYVVGQVRDPGVVSLPDGARVVDALEAAGGATGRADLRAVNLARRVADGEQILVPKPGEVVSAGPVPGGSGEPGALGATDSGSPGAGAGAGAGAGGAGQPVDLNTATEAQLDELPGVGPVIAGRIVAWRQENGRFGSVDQLGEVDGIGDATLAKLRPLVTV